MPTPRKLIVDRTSPGVYHCISRCARRLFLMGGEHNARRQWLEDRLKFLSSVFAMDDAAHSVMENHVHVLVRTAPQRAEEWSDEEVVRRWARLFPQSIVRWARSTDTAGLLESWTKDSDVPEEAIAAVAGKRHRVRDLRGRLSDLSWFKRCLKEPLARQANTEDGVTGCFWEGRFKSYRVLDAVGVLLCMVYIDLNPLRAGLVKILESSKYTSIKLRVAALKAFLHAQSLLEARPRATDAELAMPLGGARPADGEASWLAPIGGAGAAEREALLDMTPGGYIAFAEAMGRQQREGKAGVIPPEVEPVFERLFVDAVKWMEAVIVANRKWFGTAIGSPKRLAEEAARRGARRVIGAVRVYGTG